MPSNASGLAPATSGMGSNSAPADERVISVASFDEKPTSRAVTAWSEPRGTFALPGVTSIEYGLDFAAARVKISMADSPWRR